MKTWDELTATYLERLRTLGRARGTVTAAERYIERFRDFCRPFGVTRPADVTDEHAAAFEQRLQWTQGGHGQLYSPSTVQGTLQMLRLFFRWAVKERHLLLDPFREIKLRRAFPHERRRILTEQEVRILLQGPALHTLAGLRDRALLETLYGTGIRRAECAMLDVQDVDFETQTLLIRFGKGGTQRRQPIGPNLGRTLAEYLERSRPQLVRRGPTSALFVQMTGGRLPAHGIGFIVRKHARATGVGNVTPHQLRHAFATHLLQGGADLLAVQALLGHAHLDSTSTYTGVTPLQIFEEHARCHPRAGEAPANVRPPAPPDEPTAPPDEPMEGGEDDV
jgi:integrase/recombinase XerD